MNKGEKMSPVKLQKIPDEYGNMSGFNFNKDNHMPMLKQTGGGYSPPKNKTPMIGNIDLKSKIFFVATKFWDQGSLSGFGLKIL